MFDIQTEAYLRRATPPHDDTAHTSVVPAAIAASIILWTTVIITAI